MAFFTGLYYFFVVIEESRHCGLRQGINQISFCFQIYYMHMPPLTRNQYLIKMLVKLFPSYDNSAADDFEHILSKNGKSL